MGGLAAEYADCDAFALRGRRAGGGAEAAGVPDEEPAQPASIPAASARVRAALIMRFIFFMLLSSICNENTV